MAITTTLKKVHIKRVSVDQIIDLRHRVLRIGLPIERAKFEGDDDLDTHHIAAFPSPDEEIPIGCASFMLTLYNRIPAWQLRGMATEQAYRGQGIGKQILESAKEELVGSEYQYARVEMMWCNARVPAIQFYENNGWKRVSDVFDIPTAGPHIKMTKDI
jgi:GNAT superfamily N-acetyltransferase